MNIQALANLLDQTLDIVRELALKISRLEERVEELETRQEPDPER
jgi:hypothetical protein